jgi:hypothetical protein
MKEVKIKCGHENSSDNCERRQVLPSRSFGMAIWIGLKNLGTNFKDISDILVQYLFDSLTS